MNQRQRGIRLLSIVLLSAACGFARADDAPATPPGWFPFAIPWSDAATTATDVSFLNATRPAGAHGRIVTREGHFIEADTGRRVRFIGINAPAESAFPSHEDADKIAASLAKYGFNVVRLHHMDNSWGRQSASLIQQNQPGTMQLNADSLDKLDYFINALAKHGIYSNINLKVSHDWTEADGAATSVKVPWGFDKRVDKFDPKLIALQKDFARQLLTHVNAYTKLSYIDDPAVAFVEINNENSLLGNPMEPLGRALLNELVDPYRSVLAGQWNVWLKKNYHTDESLKAAWKTADEKPSGPLLTSAVPWSFEHQGDSVATLTPGVIDQSKTMAEAAPVKLDVTAVDGTVWHVQAHLVGLNLQEGKTYTLHFRAKANAPRSIGIGAGTDQADWHNIGLNETAELTTDWKTFQYDFVCTDAVPQHSRLAWLLGGATGQVWIDQITLESGVGQVGLRPGESLDKGNLALGQQMSKPQYVDFVQFLADTERAYAEQMRNVLRRDLSVRANIIDTQVDYGGLTGIEREEGSDYADSHAYWQHPQFPGKSWDAIDWTIQNSPLVDTFLADRGGDLGALAMTRVAGKPFVISEYDHPAPSDYVPEMMPMLATFAAAQDWDGFYLFALGPYGEASAGPNGGREKINGFFDVWNHPAVRSMLPAAALIFRGEQFLPLASTMTLQLPPKPYRATPFNLGAWKMAMEEPVKPLTSRLAIRINEKLSSPAVTGGDAKSFSQDSIRVEKSNGGAVWMANSPSVAAATGYITAAPVHCGAMTLHLTGSKFASAVAVSLDSKPIASSTHLLLTLAGGAMNPGMQWNATRTSIANHWGTGPVLVERFGGTISLRCGGKTAQMFPLDHTGHRGDAMTVTVDADGNAVLPLNADTMWYELTVAR